MCRNTVSTIEVRTPSMHVPHERAEPHTAVSSCCTVAPCERFGRPVEEHQEDARDSKQDEQGEKLSPPRLESV